MILGDAGQTIDSKNGQIEALQRRVETFKQDKKNLLGIVQQLATIGNPAFNFQSFMDGFSQSEEDEKAEEAATFSASKETTKRAFKTAPLFAAASQRSSSVVAKDRRPEQGRRGGGKKHQRNKQLHSIPRGEAGQNFSQHQRRSFPSPARGNAIQQVKEKKVPVSKVPVIITMAPIIIVIIFNLIIIIIMIIIIIISMILPLAGGS